ncbi:MULTISPECIES: Lsr2 dimerization domain-containing protein [unclassified Curtobacterium]|uniref:Lsr2 dimerization domain-containing protein n=1 Tax=unclassified Curtobacterium TaxID=257496 RepID=UPI00188A8E33|nr:MULTISPECIES: histone-like nucleoid-structuring protein Lsr2 [unclassified Curtobacterium]MBF4591726.1 Lsr2 family protein [Curtobacterium sp. VKM Ac-1395]MCY1692949.1 Lsr2 family protein [Curtobacterium sp. SL109]
MAQKVTTRLIDDLTGETIEDGGKNVEFSFDGNHYEIDLSDDNAEKLREAFSDYIATAARTTAEVPREVPRRIGVRRRTTAYDGGGQPRTTRHRTARQTSSMSAATTGNS